MHACIYTGNISPKDRDVVKEILPYTISSGCEQLHKHMAVILLSNIIT